MDAPIARCPQEILEHIFLASLPAPPLPDRSLTALRIAHVCSWWRTLAFHLPALWRCLFLARNSKKLSKYELFGILESTPHSPAPGNLTLLAKLYADNARDHALALHLEMHTLCRAIGPILTTYAHRLRFLRLHVIPAYTPIDALDPFVSLSDAAPRQLESLHLTWTYSSSIRFNNITTFACAPNLRKLRLGFTPPDGSSSSSSDALLEPAFDSYYFMIPWAQLTHVCMDNISLETWDDLLHSCPKLEQCLVTFGTFSHTITTSPVFMLAPHPLPHPRTIPHLKTLGVTVGRSAGLFSFEHMDMPVLETLQISAKPWTRNERARKFAWDGPNVGLYAWWKGLSTLVVSLQDMSTHMAGLVGVLPCAVALRTLQVYYIENGSDVELVLGALTVSAAHPGLLDRRGLTGGQQQQQQQHQLGLRQLGLRQLQLQQLQLQQQQQQREGVTLPRLENIKLEMANTYDLRPATTSLPLVLRDFVRCRWWQQADDDDLSRPTARLASCEIGMAFFRGRGAKSFFDDVERVVQPFRVQGLHVHVYESRCAWTCDQLTQDWW